MEIRSTILALCLAILGAGCVPSYVPGEVPTEAQLERMTPEEMAEGMRVMMEKEPPPELEGTDRQAEVSHSIDMMRDGTIERLADFEGRTFHSGQGNVKIVKNGERYQLVFDEDFSVTPGPWLVVHASNHLNPGNKKELEEFGTLEVGRLKSISGVQTYDLPEGFDIDAVKSIVIYCKPFQVVFAVASFN